MFRRKFLYLSVVRRPGNEKKIAHGIKMQKNSQTREGTFWIFMSFHGDMRAKVQLAPPHGNLINDVANHEIVYSSCLTVF